MAMCVIIWPSRVWATFIWLVTAARAPAALTWRTWSCMPQESMRLASRSTPAGFYSADTGMRDQITRLDYSWKVASEISTQSFWQNLLSAASHFLGVVVWILTRQLQKADFRSWVPFFGGRAVALGVSVLLHYPASTECQWTYRHSHFILKIFFLNMAIYIPIYGCKLARSWIT